MTREAETLEIFNHRKGSIQPRNGKAEPLLSQDADCFKNLEH